MAILNFLALRLSGKDHVTEFVELTQESLRVNKDDPSCKYIEAWRDPFDDLRFSLVSIWDTQESLDEWYRSPFHLELRKRGMQGMLESYFTHQGDLDESRSHQWRRPVRA